MRLGAGAGITGMRFAPGGEALPADGYEIELEARRVSGSDFFCGLTFPVGPGPMRHAGNRRLGRHAGRHFEHRFSRRLGEPDAERAII
ncbi:MAG: hypothetical protein R3F11_03245 [Verrucomicrobiales bacterium]